MEILQARMMNAMSSMLCSAVEGLDFFLQDAFRHLVAHCLLFLPSFVPYIAAYSIQKAPIFISSFEINLNIDMKCNNVIITQAAQPILLIQSYCNETSKQHIQMTQSRTVLHGICGAYTKSCGDGDTAM